MRGRSIFLILIAIVLVNVYRAKAQKRSTGLGSVKGALKDTIQKYILRSATISVYTVRDSVLLNYQLANSYAEFNIKDLPVMTPLKLVVSHTGYSIVSKSFFIPSETNLYDFKSIYLQPMDNTLKDVEITQQPVTMNGDTLEINPSAFKIDSNAVIEDVLRKTPGLELWGDGTITMNGRTIKKVVVDGKEFFGGDPKVALQNLPNQVVQKVQIYKETKNNNLLDSTFTMNVKLKKGKKNGLFGKVGGGYGTNHRYQADGSLNYYTAKLQLGIVGASNNVNKRTSNTSQLLSDATFKGIGASIDYQPDFSESGVQTPTAGGVNFRYDFVPDPQYNKQKSIEGDYFGSHLNRDESRSNQTQTTIADNNQIYSNAQKTQFQIADNHRFNGSYNLITPKQSLTIHPNGSTDKFVFREQSTSTELDNNKNLVSTNDGIGRSDRTSTNFHLVTEYTLQDNNSSKGFPPFKGFNAKYDVGINNFIEESNNISDFRSPINPQNNRKINRKYSKNYGINSHELNFSFPHIDDLLKKGGFKNFDIILRNGLKLNLNKDNAKVFDLDTLTNSLKRNNYLTNNVNSTTVEHVPELAMQKTFRKSLSNRFDQSLTINISAAENFTNQNTKSIKSFQNFNQRYRKFVPKAYVSFTNNQYGDYYQSLDLNYNNSIMIPTLDQLAPLADSTEVYYLYRGNANLRESKTQNLNITFSRSNQKNKNTFSVFFSLNGNISNDAIIDSTLIDAQNRRQIFYTNAKGQEYLGFDGELKKAYNLKTGKIQLTLSPGIFFQRKPSFTNGALNVSNTFSTNNELKLYYAYGDKIALEGGTSYNYSKSKQILFNTTYTSNTYSNSLSTSYNVTKRFNVSSNISVNWTSRSYSPNITYTIWNANATYRLLKGNNAEIKLSALDLLHQNNNVISTADQNVLSTVTQNVLQQYFMVTLSYYPRFFGLKGK